MEGFYIIHFDEEVDYPMRKHYGDSRHYVGISKDIEHRLSKHLSASGAKMTNAAHSQGIAMRVGRTYECTYSTKLERMVAEKATLLCTVCSSDTPGHKTIIQHLVKRSVRTGDRKNR